MERTYTIIATEWGYAAAVWTARGLWELGWPQKDRIKALEAVNPEGALEAPDDPRAEELQQELNMYYKGFQIDFSTPVDWGGYTLFQRKVLEHTAHIPYGTVQTYGQVAAAVGSPKAARAVGQSLHINRTPLVVPCHRVIGAGGCLTGFGGGLDLKKTLLMLEQVEISEE
jgi:methylated-DNA-[protein]-cysteine S-methyltransferase